VRRDGTGERDLGLAGEWPRPLWSPDGAWIAYRGIDSLQDPDEGLWLIRPDGGEKQLIVPGYIDRRMISWTADGERIDFGRRQFSHDYDEPVELWTVDVTTGVIERIEAVGVGFDAFARQP
jgi:hypothetical protein